MGVCPSGEGEEGIAGTVTAPSAETDYPDRRSFGETLELERVEWCGCGEDDDDAALFVGGLVLRRQNGGAAE